VELLELALRGLDLAREIGAALHQAPQGALPGRLAENLFRREAIEGLRRHVRSRGFNTT